MGAIRDTLWGYKKQKTENLLKTFEDKVLKNEASEKKFSFTASFEDPLYHRLNTLRRACWAAHFLFGSISSIIVVISRLLVAPSSKKIAAIIGPCKGSCQSLPNSRQPK